MSGEPLADAIFRVILGNSADPVATSKRFMGVTLRKLCLHEPVSIYSIENSRLILVCGIMNGNARRVSEVSSNRRLSLLANLNGNCSLSLSNRQPLVLNNNMNIPPVCVTTELLHRVNGRISMVLNFGAGSRVFCRRRFGTLNYGMCITATSKDCNAGNFMASIVGSLSCDCFCAYNPRPVLGTICGTSGASKRVDFRRHVNYNFKTYVNYSYGALANGGEVYGRNPIVGGRRVL